MGTEGKLFGRFNELILLLAGFLLTSVCGALIAAWLQGRAWNHQHLTSVCESEVRAGLEAYQTLSDVMDTRLFRTRRLVWKLEETKTADGVRLERSEYRVALDEWNVHLNRNRTMVKRYFGGDSEAAWELIAAEFAGIQSTLSALLREREGSTDRPKKKGAPSGDGVHELEDALDKLNPEIYYLDDRMLQMIQNQEVGQCSASLAESPSGIVRQAPRPQTEGAKGESQRTCEVTITGPTEGATVGATGKVEGRATIPSHAHLWVASHRRGLADWWPQGGAEAPIADDGSWEVTVYYGQARDTGARFEVAAVVVGDADNEQLKKWVAEAPAKGYPGRAFPNVYEGCPIRKLTVQKTSHD